MYSRTSRRGSSGWRSAPALWACGICALLVLSAPLKLSALTLQEFALITSMREDMLLARQSLEVSTRALSDLRASSDERGKLLQEARQHVERLNAQLQLWQEHSAALNSSMEQMSSELATLREELRRLTDTYNALSKLHANSSEAWERRIAARELVVRRWRTVAIAGMVGALAGGFLAGVLTR